MEKTKSSSFDVTTSSHNTCEVWKLVSTSSFTYTCTFSFTCFVDKSEVLAKK